MASDAEILSDGVRLVLIPIFVPAILILWGLVAISVVWGSDRSQPATQHPYDQRCTDLNP